MCNIHYVDDEDIRENIFERDEGKLRMVNWLFLCE